jgi:hypothetical protein
MKNVTPVIAAMANPSLPQGISDQAALSGTRLKSPSSRRSKNPTTPTSSDRATKWAISQAGHSHGCDRIASEMAVARNQIANASRVAVIVISPLAYTYAM